MREYPSRNRLGYFFAPRQGALYILEQKRGGEAHISKKSMRILDSWDFCGGIGGRNPDCGDFSCWGTSVPGGIPVNCMRMCLLPSLERSQK